MLARWLLDVGSQSIFIPKQKRVVIFGAPSCDLGGLVAAFWHPGGPFWDLGGTLGDRESSRKDVWASGVDMCGFLVFGHRGLKFSFCFGLVSRSLFVPIFVSKSGCLGLLKQGF